MDIPERIARPEKRKDKISKRDVRIIHKIKKERTKAVARARIDEEIKDEARSSEKRARTSMGRSIRKMRENTTKLTMQTASVRRKEITREMQLMQKSNAVCIGEADVPCILLPFYLTEKPTTSIEQLTEEEILRQHEGAILWNDVDYPHIIPHERLWVFCAACHHGLPSMSAVCIPYHSSPHIGSVWKVNNKGDHEIGELHQHEVLLDSATYRWRVYHSQCVP